jgi:hypothetical protein
MELFIAGRFFFFFLRIFADDDHISFTHTPPHPTHNKKEQITPDT